MVARHRINNAGVLKSLSFAQSGRRVRLATNSADRTLRLFTLPSAYPDPPPVDPETGLPVDGAGEYVFLESDLEPSHRFSDPINRAPWVGMSFSSSGELLAGGTTWFP
jgi:COMPASS component SWD1